MLRKLVFTLLAVVIACSVWIGAVAADQERVSVCHKPGTPAEATLEIAAPAEAAHLGHGDYEGECQGPQSDGCTALNAVVPDPQMNPFGYFFLINGLDFLPGETIHVDMTATALDDSAALEAVGAIDSNGLSLAEDVLFLNPGQQGTVSVDYVVVAGDDADGAGAIVSAVGLNGFTLDAVNFSCTPAP